jgi:hypothetical protein
MIQHSADIDTKQQQLYFKNIRRSIEDYDHQQRRFKRQCTLVDIPKWPFVIIGIIIFAYILHIFSESKTSVPEPISTPTTISNDPVAPIRIKEIDTLEPIRETLRRVYNTDMDNDGKISCIDYTIQFWNIYPNRDKVKVIWNKNKPYMNHLFIMIDDLAVEPQAYINPKPDKWFSMSKYWGSSYDPQYNLDVTQYMEAIKHGNYWK